ncbi:MAG: pyruvate kinase, partial [Succinimonas sp.]|nr:pyruvate kinase [Succinimonas sp.]
MRKTKIICTIGPACENEETLEAMYDAGMNVYTEDPDGIVIPTDINLLMEKVMTGIGAGSQLAGVY